MALMDKGMERSRILLVLFAALSLSAAIGGGFGAGAADNRTEQGFGRLEREVEEFRLPNGLTFLVLPRHEVPIVSMRTYVNAGGSDEMAGATGIAHMFEHMAFKGTPHIGTTDSSKEREALVLVDRAWSEVMAERRKRHGADSTRIGVLVKAFKEAEEGAGRFVVSNEFASTLEQEGASELNAFTNVDHTQYIYNLPSNKVSLLALLEGDHLAHPVLREFYKERDVVIEERRISYESTPTGRLFEDLLTTAFSAHPYGNGVIGHRSDLESFSRADAEDFYRKHYVAKNMVIAVVGDVDRSEMERLADRYFSDISAAQPEPPVDTVEPPQNAEKRILMEDEAQPLVLMGYHMPDVNDPRYHAYLALADVLGEGRSSRLYTSLVKERKVAVQAGTETGMPGEKYPCLLFGYIVPASGVDPDTALTVFDAEVRRLLAGSPVTAEELDAVKTRSRAQFWRGVQSNEGMAGQLAYYQGMTGDWRNLFREAERMNAVTIEDVMSAASECLRPENRTVAVLRKRSGSSS